jgi:amino acid transporter
LAYVAPFGIWGSYGALAMCSILAIFKNFSVFIHMPKSYGDFDYKNFITGYLGIPLYIIMIFAAKGYWKTEGVKSHMADFYTGKAEIDREEELFVASKTQANDRGVGKAGKLFYRRFLSWLF